MQDRNNNTIESRPRHFRVVFVLLLLIPCITTIAFGGADASAPLFLSPLVAAVAVMWLIGALREGELRLNRDALLLPLVGMTALGCIQLLSPGTANVSTELLSIPASNSLSLDPYATRIFVFRLAGYLVFFAACLTFIDSERRIKAAVNTIVIFGASIAIAGILQRLASPDAIYGVRPVEQAIPFGPFVNQHHFAALMVMTSGIAISRIFDRTARPDRKLLFGLAAFVMLGALLMTSSRGGLIAYFSMLGVAVLFGVRSRGGETSASSGKPLKAAGVAIAVIILIVGLVVFLGGEDALLRAVGLQQNQADISSGRLHFWSVALKIFAANPLIGAGLDAFGVAFTRYDTWNGTFRVEQAHNDYLQILADCGVLGFACLASFVFLLVRKSLSAIAGSRGFIRSATVGVFAGCVGILVHSFFDFPLRTPANALFFLLLVAIACNSKSDGFSRLREDEVTNLRANG